MGLGRPPLIVCSALALLACGPKEHADVSGVVRDGRTGKGLAGALLRGPGGVETRAEDGGRFTIRLPVDDEVTLRAAATGRCSGKVQVDVGEEDTPEVTVNLFPRLEIDSVFPQVGFDQEVTVEARTRCDPQTVVRWSQMAGPELGADRLRIEDGGRRVIVRTHALADLVELDDRLGVVPLSRRERADYRLRVEAELAGAVDERQVRITAAATQGGVFQVPSGADLYLNGGAGDTHGWTLVSKPEGSEAAMIDAQSRTPHLRPDLFGQYLVRYEPTGLDINIQAGPYEEVPRDCGREGCHAAEDRGWTTTKHARTFRRGLEGELGEDFDESCWGCHATGVERGVDNGGLHRTAARIGWRQPDPHQGAFDEAPRLIRRHGSVWCSACHGPGRILPPQFHWQHGAKFQSGVCARCHDAVDDPDSPHQSWQYREWEASSMASFVRGLAEDDPAVRSGCASCHSAQGFVAWQRHDRRITPDRTTVVAVSCTTCHDAHDASRPHALRVHDAVDPVGGQAASGLGTGAICASCHRSDIAQSERESRAPHAPQSDVLLGRGSALLRKAVPGGHSRLADSCVSCHMARPERGDPLLGRAGGHTFSVRDVEAEGSRAVLSATACAACHGTEVPPQAIGGIRDWNGDRREDNVGEEFDAALATVRAALRERIPFARVHDECEPALLATDFVEQDALLLLTDAEGALLGDCDGDGRFTGREEPVGADALSRALHDVVWDVALLEKDGSHGRHNPAFAFRALRAAAAALR